MAEDLNARLHWLDEELKSQEAPMVWQEAPEQDELGPGYNYAQDFGRAMYQDECYGSEEPRKTRKKEKKKKKKSIKGLLFLALLEILALWALLGWWLQWVT